jgi:hypothetical protein
VKNVGILYRLTIEKRWEESFSSGSSSILDSSNINCKSLSLVMEADLLRCCAIPVFRALPPALLTLLFYCGSLLLVRPPLVIKILLALDKSVFLLLFYYSGSNDCIKWKLNDLTLNLWSVSINSYPISPKSSSGANSEYYFYN